VEKWADYLISAVRYEDNLHKKVISYLKIHRDNGDTVGEGSTWTLEEVLTAMNKGATFITISKVNGGKWKKGESIFIASPDVLFLKTASDKLIYNDLVTIPEF
jgi:hypothetical protein